MTIYLYTGNGAGKTTNALGLVVRMLGHGKKVLMIQFLKWQKNTGEYEFQFRRNIVGDFEVHQFGREGWKGFDNLTIEDSIKTKEGLLFAHNLLVEKHFDLLIHDEINLAVYLKLLTIEEIQLFINCLPYDLNIIMTGRHASQELMDLADVVNEINELKAPKTLINEKGI